MAKIRVLTEETINQIAAGEVVENPAAVVKELVENAIDARAQEIVIEIRGGGFQLIKIADDGMGMGADDAILCFERHATSKISKIDDLSTLYSMGFRGEALASIAAIARVEMTTATGEAGTRVNITAGKIESITPAPRRRGTTFEVRSLFFNVPARKKFQKQAAAATAEIHRLVVSLALAHPEVGFELISNEEAVLKVASVQDRPWMEGLKRRIEDLFQGGRLQKKIPLEGEEGGYRVQGFLAAVEEHRVNRTGQHLFINRRPIFSTQISYAVKEGYGERLGSDRYPVFVLHVEVPAERIDVNIHPQKKEVRFQEGDVVRRLLQRCVQRSFAPKVEKSFFVPNLDKEFSFEAAPLCFQEEALPQPVMFRQEDVIGVFAHYLLLEGSTVGGFCEGIVFVDLRKAQEQMVYKELTESVSGWQSQGLLLPIPVELTKIEVEAFRHKKEELFRLGFVVQESGKQTILVESLPSFVEEIDVREMIRLVLEADEEFLPLSKRVAHFAFRKKRSFALPEAIAIWNRFKSLNSREGMVGIEKDDIENFFKTHSKIAR